MTPAKRLEEIGSALYGRSWQSDLARLLDVSGRTMRRWAAGETKPPDQIWSDLDEWIVHRIRHLQEIRK